MEKERKRKKWGMLINWRSCWRKKRRKKKDERRCWSLDLLACHSIWISLFLSVVGFHSPVKSLSSQRTRRNLQIKKKLRNFVVQFHFCVGAWLLKDRDEMDSFYWFINFVVNDEVKGVYWGHLNYIKFKSASSEPV